MWRKNRWKIQHYKNLQLNTSAPTSEKYTLGRIRDKTKYGYTRKLTPKNAAPETDIQLGVLKRGLETTQIYPEPAWGPGQEAKILLCLRTNKACKSLFSSLPTAEWKARGRKVRATRVLLTALWSWGCLLWHSGSKLQFKALVFLFTVIKTQSTLPPNLFPRLLLSTSARATHGFPLEGQKAQVLASGPCVVQKCAWITHNHSAGTWQGESLPCYSVGSCQDPSDASPFLNTWGSTG